MSIHFILLLIWAFICLGLPPCIIYLRHLHLCKKDKERWAKEDQEDHEGWYRGFKCMADLHQESDDKYMELLKNSKDSEESRKITAAWDRSKDVINEAYKEVTE